jgi:hypothetical protein
VCSTNKEPEQEPTAKTQAPVLVMVGCESYTNYRGDSCGICFYNDTDYSFQDYLNGASLTFEDFCD